MTACATPRRPASSSISCTAPHAASARIRPSHSRCTSHGAEPERVAEREERPHREQVAAVLAALHVPEVAGRRPRARDVAQETGGIDVQVDLRVRGRQPGPLQRARCTNASTASAAGRGVGRACARRRGYGPALDGSPTRRHSAARPAGPRRLRARRLLRRRPAARGDRRVPAGRARRRGRAACPAERAARVAIGGLAALTAWSALSLTWAPLAGPAVDDVERNVLYLAALRRRGDAADDGLGRGRAAGGDHAHGRLRPVGAAAAGSGRARALGRGGRPPGPAADVLERPGRAGRGRPRAGRGPDRAPHDRRPPPPRRRPCARSPARPSRSSGSTST